MVVMSSLAASTLAAVIPEPSRWADCDGAPAPVECAWLTVPLDRADPDARTIRLPLSRLRASHQEHRVGTLVTIAGGPGQRGTLGVWPGAHTRAIHEHFDIVSWDPRGTSGETLIDCVPEWDPFAALDRTPDSAVERRRLDERTAALASRCREAHRDLLPHLGRLQDALDLEALRQRLGEERISLLGSSYGSQIALAYATLFPHRVRAVVLDGYSDPNVPPGEREVEQAAAYERELQRVLAGCATDTDCPLGKAGDVAGNEGGPGASLDRLLERLDTAPLPIAGGGSLSQSDAYEAIVGALTRDDTARQALLRALADAVDGDGTALLGIASEVRRSYQASGLTLGAFMALYCADTSAYWHGLSAHEAARLTARVWEAAPRLGAWLWSPPADPDLPPVGLCAMHPPRFAAPAAPLSSRPFDAAGAGPVLILASSGDPSTPVEAARRALDDVEQAVLVTIDAPQHLAYLHAVHRPEQPAYRCLLDVVEGYLIELVVPSGEVACKDG
jgi:pimeloyl-ACP methyl ester carboxylesterase